jgi:hypothetical protein
MNLGEAQELFMEQLPYLLNSAFDMGYKIRGGDLFRDPRVHGAMGEKVGYGAANSNHKLKLAIDLNLFHNRQFIGDTEGHRLLGEWWEAQHPHNRWGGRFDDGNHYEMLQIPWR